jgi:hypothetical protein
MPRRSGQRTIPAQAAGLLLADRFPGHHTGLALPHPTAPSFRPPRATGRQTSPRSDFLVGSRCPPPGPRSKATVTGAGGAAEEVGELRRRGPDGRTRLPERSDGSASPKQRRSNMRSPAARRRLAQRVVILRRPERSHLASGRTLHPRLPGAQHTRSTFASDLLVAQAPPPPRSANQTCVSRVPASRPGGAGRGGAGRGGAGGAGGRFGRLRGLGISRG